MNRNDSVCAAAAYSSIAHGQTENLSLNEYSQQNFTQKVSGQ